MRIAHFSDLHVLALEGVAVRRFLNKRLTGWANLRLNRGAVHRTSYVRAIAREVARIGVEHVVITGDLTNLALESEFARVREILDRDLDMDPSRVTLVPGNHDVYTRGALTSRRFERYFSDWLVSDLPELAVDTGGGHFPVVKLRGPAAIIGISSAVPRMPFVAAGAIGPRQIAALARVLAHPEVLRRTVLIAMHHPAIYRSSNMKQFVNGLRDAPSLLSLLRSLERGLVVHGHLHRRVQGTITTATGHVNHVGATSASLYHAAPDRMAGFNLYDIEDQGLTHVEARVYDGATASFHGATVPMYA
jgi:3',5'-cyclic AMP phosphodiesterase CpdA